MRETTELLQDIRAYPRSRAWRREIRKLHNIDAQDLVGRLVKAALENAEKSMRSAAVTALREVGGREAISDLVEVALSDGEKVKRNRANHALKQIGGEDLRTIVLEALKCNSSMRRARAARILGRIPSQNSANDLAKALADECREVRASVAQALKRVCNQEILRLEGGNKVIEHLADAIDDPDSVVRVRIVDTLKQIGGSRALQVLRDTLKDRDSFVRAKSAYALGFLESNRVLKDLSATLRDKEVLPRAKAAEALGKIGDRRAVPDLVKSLADNAKIVRASAAWSLGQIGFHSATPELIKASRDVTSAEVRANATLALGQIADPRAVLRIVEAANDEDNRVRQNAVKALGRLGQQCVKHDVRASEHAIAALVEVLKSERTELHGKAAESLRQITDNEQLLKQALTAVVDALQDIGRKKALRESQVERERYIQTIYESALTDEPTSKGKALETLLAALFSSVEGFVLVDRDHPTEDEEIDLILRNESKHPFWEKEGALILVECKNWRSKRVGKNEFVAFEQKVENRGGRCRLGFLICVDEFADTVRTEMLRFSKTDKLIVPINGERLRQLVESNDRNQLLIEFVTAASLT